MSIRQLLVSMILARLVAAAQDPSAVLEGLVTDRLQGALAGGLPVDDLNSPNFGRVLEAGAPRLVQFALKLLY